MHLQLQTRTLSALARYLCILIGLSVAVHVSAAPVVTRAGSFSNPCGLTPPTLSPASQTVTVGSGPVSVTATGCSGGIIQYFGSGGVYTVAPGSAITIPSSATGTYVIPALCSKSGCTSDVAEAVVVVVPAGGDPNVNSRPAVVNPIGTLNGTVNVNFTFQVPSTTFSDPQNDQLTLTANGLPPGLTFNGLVINGAPTVAGNFEVTITATDPGGLSTNTIFSFIVEGGPGAPPDLSPTISLPNSNFGASPDNSRNFIVDIAEVSGHPTSSGNVAITVTVPAGFTISFDNSITSIAVSGGSTETVNNPNWTVSSNINNQQLSLLMNGGQFIPASGKSTVGFTVTRTTANAGSVSTININVNDDINTTYDGNNANNIFSRIIQGL